MKITRNLAMLTFLLSELRLAQVRHYLNYSMASFWDNQNKVPMSLSSQNKIHLVFFSPKRSNDGWERNNFTRAILVVEIPLPDATFAKKSEE
jgi:hypothetical protein